MSTSTIAAGAVRELTTTTQPILLTTAGLQFPRKAWQRWLLRAAFSLPFAIFAVLATGPGVTHHVQTANSMLIHQAATLPSNFTLTELPHYFPPLTLGVAFVIPSALGLGIVGALVAGWFLAELLRVVTLAGLKPSQTILGLIAIGMNPVFAAVGAFDLPAFAATLFFGIALVDTFRFVTRNDTRSGFRAGIFLLLASLTSWSGLLFTLIASIAAPLFVQSRNDRMWSRVSNSCVLIFPTLATFGAVSLLSLLVNHAPLQIARTAITYHPEQWAIFAHVFTQPSGLIASVPLLLVSVFAIVIRRPASILLAVLVFVIMALGKVYGLIPAATLGQTYIATFMIGVAHAVEIGRRPRRGVIWIYWSLLVVASWVLPFVVPELAGYLQETFRALG